MQLILRSGLGLLAVALLFDLAGIPIVCATLGRQTPPAADAKERLRVAAAVSLELAPLAVGSEKILRQSHVARYSAARPWASLWGGGSCDSFVTDWPTEMDAPALRAMLADGDPNLRGLALEALSILRLPEDVPRIASFLNDESPAPPYVGSSGRSVTSVTSLSVFAKLPGNLAGVTVLSKPPQDPDPRAELYSWYPATVSTYAVRALGLVTGVALDAKTFDQWWTVNKNYNERLWYWNQRIRGEVLLVQRSVREELRLPTPVNADEWDRRQKSIGALMEKRLEQLRKRLADEAMLLEPETAAKILLLATDCENTGDHPYFESTPRLPLSASRLLELLDGERLWPDVDWKADGHYSRLVSQIMLATPGVFGPDDVTRLQAIFARQRGHMWSNANGAMFVGISRLLPAAQGDFNPETRQGYLRAAIDGGSDMFARDAATAELVRVDLPGQWKYLKKVLFSQPRVGDYPDLVQTIVRGLGECPITPAKREALLELLKDKRIKPLLKQEDERYRYYLGWTIRDHLAQDVGAPREEFSTRSGNPLDALPGIVARLTARAKAGPPVETCK